MEKQLQNKVAIITGGGSWIGKEIAKVFAANGAKIIIIGRNNQKIAQTADEIRQSGGNADHFSADISKENEVAQVLKQITNKYDKIDILVQNAAIYPSSMIDNMPYEQWQQVINTNLNGSFLVLKYASEFIKKSPAGRIIFISSVAGEKIGKEGLAHYAASKAGLNRLMRTAALEFAKYNVTCNSINPGNILNIERFSNQFSKSELDDMLVKIPLGRTGTPKDIASLALFLASAEASFITGQSLVVDGGETIT